MILGVIPVRLESERLPRKPLAIIREKTLVERVWKQATLSKKLSKLVVATDSDEIIEVVTGFGGEVVKTSSNPKTGTDRVCEAAIEGYDIVANIQGDMPFINPKLIDSCLDFIQSTNAEIVTPATAILNDDEFFRESTVKVAIGNDNKALYFSRAPIPYPRKRNDPIGFKHIGLYVFRSNILKKFPNLPQAEVEEREKLEQLRALAAGIDIRILVAPSELTHPGIEVDTPEDLKRANEFAQLNG